MIAAVTRIRTWVTSATTKGTNHYTITATGTDENTSSFLRNLRFTPLFQLLASFIIKGRWKYKWGSYPNSTPESVCG